MNASLRNSLHVPITSSYLTSWCILVRARVLALARARAGANGLTKKKKTFLKKSLTSLQTHSIRETCVDFFLRLRPHGRIWITPRCSGCPWRPPWTPNHLCGGPNPPHDKEEEGASVTKFPLGGINLEHLRSCGQFALSGEE